MKTTEDFQCVNVNRFIKRLSSCYPFVYFESLSEDKKRFTHKVPKNTKVRKGVPHSPWFLSSRVIIFRSKNSFLKITDRKWASKVSMATGLHINAIRCYFFLYCKTKILFYLHVPIFIAPIIELIEKNFS